MLVVVVVMLNIPEFTMKIVSNYPTYSTKNLAGKRAGIRAPFLTLRNKSIGRMLCQLIPCVGSAS
jgi:hypothetical protein